MASRQESMRDALIALCVVGNAVALTRLGLQLGVYHRPHLDDLFVLLATVLADVVIILDFLAVDQGLGLPAATIGAQHPGGLSEHLETIFKYIYVTSILQIACLASVKLSLLVLCRRIFLVHQRWLLIAWWLNLVYIVLWLTGSVFFYIFQCSPATYYWTRFGDVPPQDGHCLATTSTGIGVTLALSLVNDITLLSLPIITLATLKTSLLRRAGLIIVFGIGVLATGIGLARVIISFTTLRTATDPTYTYVPFLIISVAELMCAIMCACLPLMALAFTLLKKHTGFLKPKGNRDQAKAVASRASRFGRSRAAPFSELPGGGSSSDEEFVARAHGLPHHSDGAKSGFGDDVRMESPLSDEIYVTTELDVLQNKRKEREPA